MARAPGSDGGTDAVEALMAGLFARSGEPSGDEIEALLSAHPEHADELRRRFRLLRALDAAAPAADETIPERLGDFRLLERIGRGGMGVVYRAEQLSLGRQVALKLVRPEHLYFPGARTRFRREVEAVARLEHVGIVPVYSVGEERGVPYFAMQLLEGCTLAEVVEELRGRAPEGLRAADLTAALAARGRGPRRTPEPDGSWQDACLEIVHQIALALAHAHGQGILHRDVKPSNVALLPSGRAMLFDFGLTSSGEQERLTRTGSQVGTLYYMAPEQLRGAATLDGRVDVYALGVTLYELLTLQVPFQGETAAETQRLVLEGVPDSIRARNRRVSSDAEIVCLQAMALEPQHRYADAAALARDLENVFTRRPIEARPPGPGRRLARWVQRNPSRAAAVGLSALLALGTPSALLWQQRSYAAELEGSLEKETTALQQEKVARADSDTMLRFISNLFQEADPARARGSDPRLSELLERGVAELDTLGDQPLIQARAAHVLGDVYMRLAHYDEARALIEDALRIETTTLGAASRESIGSLDNLATVLLYTGEIERAESILRELVEVGTDPCDRAAAHNNLATVLDGRGAAEEAMAYQRDAIRLYEECDEAEPTDRLVVMVNLAALLKQTGHLEEAARTAGEAIDALRATVEPPHPLLGNALSLAGSVCRELGDLEQAEVWNREAVEMLRRVYPEGHDQLSGALFNLAVVLEKRGSLVEAERLMSESVDMLLAVTGPGHPKYAPACADLAKLRARIAAGQGGERAPLDAGGG